MDVIEVGTAYRPNPTVGCQSVCGCAVQEKRRPREAANRIIVKFAQNARANGLFKV